MPYDKSIRIGIDVGGTFTHAVAIDSSTMELLGTSKVPTTHKAREGVAKGIIEALEKLLKETRISPEQVGFIAHSTTQATNALLEGDVASVGILGMASGMNAYLASGVSRLGRVKLAEDKYLRTYHAFINTTGGISESAVREALQALVDSGAETIAVSEAFSVDDPDNEATAVEIAREMGLPATAGHEVSRLYGFKVRTRTAVINASMLPKMIESADMTEKSVQEAGIEAPVMIMRSDGGVMDIESMRKRPILTMLSGPAAGVAAAMMFLHISDGVFLEVGGTSTDISAISNGRAKIRAAEVGGHRVYMRTLDVRTEGVAGGSLAREKDGKLVDVGPRSAHIAGLGYSSFDPPVENSRVQLISPLAGDPEDYISITNEDESVRFAITPTCASNFLGLVPDDDCASGDRESIDKAFTTLGKAMDEPPHNLAEKILQLAAEKCEPRIRSLIKDHNLDPELVTLVGGGGGAAAIVPYVARRLGMRYELARNADVISAIGVALALIRETVERQIVNPTNEDILKIREDAFSAVEKMGADPGSIEIQVEIDSRTNVVRATAYGASNVTDEAKRENMSSEDRVKLVAESMRVEEKSIALAFDGDYFQIYSADRMEKKLFGLLRQHLNSLRIIDQSGIIRLQFKNAAFDVSQPATAGRMIENLLEAHADWGDAGKVIPDMILLAGSRIVDLSGLPDVSQVVSLAKAELESLPQGADVVAIARLS